MIPAGSFLMGSGDDRYEDVRYPPIPHEVILSRQYMIGAYPVTQEQFHMVMGSNPSKDKGTDLPVTTVPWDQAVRFCDLLSDMESRSYRLPTEAEWEYACRAGSSALFCFGDDAWGNDDSNRPFDAYGWDSINSEDMIHPVGQKQPNAWGIYDMHGNQWEWCNDLIGEYPTNSVVDPQGAASGRVRVRRGGAFWTSCDDCSSPHRNWDNPNPSNYSGADTWGGFRVVLDVDDR